MTSRAHKRKDLTVDSIGEPDESPTPVARALSAGRSALSLISMHRWKATVAVGVAAIGLAASMGIVDLGRLTSWTTAQYAPDRSGVTAATATAPAAQATAQATAEPGLTAASKPEIATCFTPGQDCMGMIVTAIDGAKAEILVQAYSFTAKPLIKALGRAHLRGVKVRVILDKADERERDRAGSRLIAQRILPQVDTGVASAHNKVIVIDRDTVITGSFNFTEAAQKKNAENVLVIKGHRDIAAAYRKNWERRLAASRPYYGTMAPVM